MDRQPTQTAFFGTERRPRPLERHYKAPGTQAPLSDIACRVVVGRGSNPATDTLEFIPAGPVTLVDHATARAASACVARLHEHASQCRFVDDQAAQGSAAFGIGGDGLAQDVVRRALKPRLSARCAPERTLGGTGAELLQGAAAGMLASANVIDLGARVGLAAVLHGAGQETKNPLVIGLSGVPAKTAPGLLITSLQAISDLGDTTHGGLGGQAEPGAQRGVSSLVQIKLASGLGVRCQARQPVAARVPSLQGVAQQNGLLWRRQQPDRGDELHRADALLSFNGATNNRFGDCSDAASVIAAAPKRRQTGTDRSELVPENAAGPAHNPVDDLGDRQGRASLNEQMHMVGHHFHRMDHHAVFLGGLDDRFLKPVVNRRSQHFAPILRTPYEVIFHTENRRGIDSLSRFSVHAPYCADARYIPSRTSRGPNYPSAASRRRFLAETAMSTIDLPGFAEPVANAQASFRAVLDAMARPGRIHEVGVGLTPPAPLAPASAAVLLTLVDHDTPLWLDPDAAASLDWIAFHCGAPIAAVPKACAFALALSLPDLMTLPPGSHEAPESSATVILQVRAFESGRRFRLDGPGLHAPTVLAVDGLPADFVCVWQQNRALFPRGVDMVLCAGTLLAALPRSVTVQEG
jgi:alpha-D-ribose 1-methylphosphonate 5-triphosphate synthase subunit PhnH